MNSLLFLRASTQKINNLPSHLSSDRNTMGKNLILMRKIRSPKLRKCDAARKSIFLFFFIFSNSGFSKCDLSIGPGKHVLQRNSANHSSAYSDACHNERLATFCFGPVGRKYRPFWIFNFQRSSKPLRLSRLPPHRPPAPRLAPGLPVARAIHRRPTIRHPFDSLFLFFFLFFHRSTRHTLNYAYLAFKCYRIQGTEEITEDASDFRFRTPLFWVSEILGYIYIFFSTLLHILKIILEASINQLKLICIER